MSDSPSAFFVTLRVGANRLVFGQRFERDRAVEQTEHRDYFEASPEFEVTDAVVEPAPEPEQSGPMTSADLPDSEPEQKPRRRSK